MKYNMGCGHRKIAGYVNVDKMPACSPNVVMDLEALPWPIESNQAEEVRFVHCLEHMGADADTFFGIIRELYRICRHGAKVVIEVPHPRHDDFIGDPTHVRIINPRVLTLFSRKNNLRWKQEQRANTTLALFLDVDLELTDIVLVPDERYREQVIKGELTTQQLEALALERNNVVQEYRMTLRVIKEPHAPGMARL